VPASVVQSCAGLSCVWQSRFNDSEERPQLVPRKTLSRGRVPLCCAHCYFKGRTRIIVEQSGVTSTILCRPVESSGASQKKHLHGGDKAVTFGRFLR
jgi:hypothetical protein